MGLTGERNFEEPYFWLKLDVGDGHVKTFNAVIKINDIAKQLTPDQAANVNTRVKEWKLTAVKLA